MMCLSVVKCVCPVIQVFCGRYQDIRWCPSLTIEFMVSSAVHAWRRTWEHESLWCHGHGDSAWYLAISILCKKSQDILALCRISWLPLISMPCGGGHETGSHEEGAMGSGSEVLGSALLWLPPLMATSSSLPTRWHCLTMPPLTPAPLQTWASCEEALTREEED